MNRHVKMSVVLIALLLAVACLFTGCKADELEAKVDENATKAEASVQDATTKADAADKAVADKAAADLASAKAALEKLIADGDAAGAADLVEAKLALEAAIEAAKTAANTADTALKAELVAAIDAAKKVADDAMAAINAWGDATDALVEGAFVELENAFATYYEKALLYTEAGFANIRNAYVAAEIRLMRAATVGDVVTALTTFKTTAAAEKTITDVIYDKLMAAGKTVNDISLESKAALEEAKELLDEAQDPADKPADVLNAILTDIAAYGEAELNLNAVYSTYKDRYDFLVRQADGQEIKDAMDEVLANLITIDVKSTLASIRGDYDLWISNSANSLADVEGFATTYAKFVAAEARVTALESAKNESVDINKAILDLKAAITLNGATVANQTELTRVAGLVDAWDARYFAGDYAAEIEANTVNYQFVNHAELDALETKYAELVEAFKAAAKAFTDALEAIGTVDILDGGRIAAAWEAYNNWVYMANLGSFDYSLGGGQTPADVYNTLLNKNNTFDKLVADARDAYIAAFAGIDGKTVANVTIYDGDAIDAVLAWYNTYGAKVEGELVFENGYVLSDTLTVTAADYQAVVALKSAYTALYTAKMAEKAEVENLIAAIGNVTYLSKDAIKAASDAYTAWLNGSKVIEGYSAAQYAVTSITGDFVIDITALDTAKTKWEELDDALTNIHSAIAGLADKKDASDFADAADYTTYSDAISAIEADIEAFKIANGGNLEGQISEGEFAKIAAAKLACAKYNGAVVAKEKYDAAIEGVTNTDTLAKMALAYENALAQIAGAKDDVENEKTALEIIEQLLVLFDAELAAAKNGVNA